MEDSQDIIEEIEEKYEERAKAIRRRTFLGLLGGFVPLVGGAILGHGVNSKLRYTNEDVLKKHRDITDSVSGLEIRSKNSDIPYQPEHIKPELERARESNREALGSIIKTMKHDLNELENSDPYRAYEKQRITNLENEAIYSFSSSLMIGLSVIYNFIAKMRNVVKREKEFEAYKASKRPDLV